MKERIGLLWILLMGALALAAEPEESLLGAWVNQANANETLEFFGNGIGAKAQYFRYSFPAADEVTYEYGAGQPETFTLSLVGGDLHLTDTSGNTTVYHRAAGSSGCMRYLKQIAGAKAVFAANTPEVESPGLSELVGRYLNALPGACAEGGVYSIQRIGLAPRCSVHGELPPPGS